ncbi:MAG: class I SAM-dependent methyltransferase [Nitrososphaerales archaeon]|nr:class I SAM-dependent methyltransferase [Nitrososphaerales archaeon]
MSFFDSSYAGVPPWDIGRPQREFVGLAKAGEVKGDLIDVGCGTGENAILFAGLGHRTLGVDLSPRAVEKARGKAKERGSSAEFKVHDALRLPELKRTFQSAIDAGCFHTFSDEGRTKFEESLSGVLRPGGRYFMLCFSDREPTGWGGPRRVSKKEIKETFKIGWRVDYIRAARFESTFHPHGGEAWLSRVTKL